MKLGQVPWGCTSPSTRKKSWVFWLKRISEASTAPASWTISSIVLMASASLPAGFGSDCFGDVKDWQEQGQQNASKDYPDDHNNERLDDGLQVINQDVELVIQLVGQRGQDCRGLGGFIRELEESDKVLAEDIRVGHLRRHLPSLVHGQDGMGDHRAIAKVRGDVPDQT